MRIIGSSEGDPDSVITLPSLDSVSSTSAHNYNINSHSEKKKTNGTLLK